MDLWDNEIISYGLRCKKGDRKGYFEGLRGFLELKKKYTGMAYRPWLRVLIEGFQRVPSPI